MKCALLKDTPVLELDTGEEKTLVQGRLIKTMNTAYENRRLVSIAHYFASLKSAVDNIPEQYERLFIENLLDDLSVCGGIIDVKLLHELLKKLYDIESVAFHRMNETDFQAFKKFALDKIQILTGGNNEKF